MPTVLFQERIRMPANHRVKGHLTHLTVLVRYSPRAAHVLVIPGQFL